jgi:antitoxin component of MazEF toxin-antitoxin module
MESCQIENKYILIKKIAKHGNQAVICIPKILEEQLKPGIVTQVTIEVIEN